jgi:regulatory protein YycI of two-component signal transduction system YycFG
MSRFIVALLVIALVVVGVGYYLDWFQVKKDDSTGKTSIQVTIDKEKIKADEDRAKAKIQDLRHQAGERTKEATGSSHPDKS